MSANGHSADGAPTDQRSVFFFDIDNCLYPKSYKIHDLMGVLIDNYFQNHLGLTQDDAETLHQRYYKDYGLAIEGLARHHRVDPLEYNRLVDDALPLDGLIKPDPKLRQLLENIDRTKIKPWLFTNAHITHGQRVVKLLEIDDLFEGITYCDYTVQPLLCKPAVAMYDKAMRESGAQNAADCYFVDDSMINIIGSKKYGWKSVHLVEPMSTSPPQPVGHFQIAGLEELRHCFPEVFKKP
ncbi:hypothetical protein B0A48_16217 [Cryoendolithus antarcticus]|uniref:Pyrimidine 5'-nucleotidase n=1 Tax=Cryoendolithus antarcticus TaxID=1507870 RepID=A0A1V8SFK0_9PEZI|nr:hypothetical protein B0A48_16217 [Cryoendolithus antarcticus]